MGSYTVVIFPDNANSKGDSSDVPRLTIRVDAAEPDMRVVGIAIKTTAPGGLTSEEVLGVDIAAIVKAMACRFLPAAYSAVVSTGSLSSALIRQQGQMALREASATRAVDPVPAPHIAQTDKGRAYRKMPDIGELRATYERLGTVTAVAKHYGVPRHTAQGWMGRLRKLDHLGEPALRTSTRPSSRTDIGEQ
ncbi:hypothetical protein [Nocardia sp. NPDC057272]|uniref:hypothetical protein n=1 Tax=Nocardia sp. NPDC057272 TaxID=3346079 RepID=UPI00362850E6